MSLLQSISNIAFEEQNDGRLFGEQCDIVVLTLPLECFAKQFNASKTIMLIKQFSLIAAPLDVRRHNLQRQ